MRPRLWIVPYTRGWSYEQTVRGILPTLEQHMDVRVAFSDDVAHGALGEWEADCYLDLWWRGTVDWAYGRRVIRQVSSHRWTMPWRWGLPTQRLGDLLGGVGSVVVPSRRLHSLLGNHSEVMVPVRLAQKGFDPTILHNHGRRRGPVRVCWAGVSERDKRLNVVLDAAPDCLVADKVLTRREMCDFYNRADVLVVASEAEGDPRTLIEGMACGLFPVCTDVGIVPELVRHGENGIILSDVAELPWALEWCRSHPDHVRDAGHQNALQMLATRTWEHVALTWLTAVRANLELS